MLRASLLRRSAGAVARAGVRELKVQAGDLRTGHVVVSLDGQPADRLFRVEEFVRGKAGKGAAFVQVKMRDLLGGSSLTQKFNTDERVESVELESERRFIFLCARPP